MGPVITSLKEVPWIRAVGRGNSMTLSSDLILYAVTSGQVNHNVVLAKLSRPKVFEESALKKKRYKKYI